MKKVFVSLALLTTMFLLADVNNARKQSEASGYNIWLKDSLARMETIEVGATREDLLKVFTTEGGLSTRTQRTFVYRDSPYIKVDVEFEPVGDEQDKLAEKPPDRVKKISRPYLALVVTD